VAHSLPKSLAVVSLTLCVGSFLLWLYLFIHGVALGDYWLIDPDHVPIAFWLLPPAFAIVSVWLFFWARRIRQRYERRHAFCIKCGYDLRASEGRCPECGTVFTRPDQ
jgi:hypothetical protein